VDDGLPGPGGPVPLTPAVDPVTGDDQVSYQIVCWVDKDLHDAINGAGDTEIAPKPLLQLRTAAGTSLDIKVGDQTSGQTWLTLGGAGFTLAALAQLRLELGF
jgi:hypothetical protein